MKQNFISPNYKHHVFTIKNLSAWKYSKTKDNLRSHHPKITWWLSSLASSILFLSYTLIILQKRGILSTTFVFCFFTFSLHINPHSSNPTLPTHTIHFNNTGVSFTFPLCSYNSALTLDIQSSLSICRGLVPKPPQIPKSVDAQVHIVKWP